MLGGAGPFTLRNARTNAQLAAKLDGAFDSKARKAGLLGRSTFTKGEGLVIAPCNGVHTFGMRFPIDVLFVARDGRVVKLRARVPARRIALALRAFAAIELPAGSAAASGTTTGDRLVVESA